MADVDKELDALREERDALRLLLIERDIYSSHYAPAILDYRYYEFSQKRKVVK